jgi:hypothetical protein
MPPTKEQLLAEVEDLIRTAPTYPAIRKMTESNLAWLGRFSAVIRAWNGNRGTEVLALNMGVHTLNAGQNLQRIFSLLHEARHSLRMETVGPVSVAVGHGQVFDYFDEVRRVIEEAKQDLLFVDPYLDAEFVSRYLNHVSAGVTIRLLARQRFATLLPAVDLFATQSQLTIQVRAAPNFHDRYVFVDRSACYQSGASFKDGVKTSPTTLTQINDAFAAVFQTYENLWANAKVER